MKKFYLIAFLVMPISLVATVTGDIGVAYTTRSIHGSQASFETFLPERSGWALDRMDLKIFARNFQMKLYGSGLGKSSMNRNFMMRGKWGSRFSFTGSFAEYRYLFYRSDHALNTRWDDRRWQQIHIMGDYLITPKWSLFLSLSRASRRGNGGDSQSFFGSILPRKFSLKDEEGWLEGGLHYQGDPWYFSLSYGISRWEREHTYAFGHPIEALSSGYVHQLLGGGKDAYDDTIPFGKLQLHFLTPRFQVRSFWGYWEGSISGSFDEVFSFLFGQEGQLNGESTRKDRYTNDLSQIEGVVDLQWDITPWLSFTDTLVWSDQTLEGNLFTESLVSFYDPDTDIFLDFPYDATHTSRLEVERSDQRGALTLLLSPSLSLYMGHRYRERTFDINSDISRIERGWEGGLLWEKKRMRWELGFERGSFSQRFFATEPLDYDGYYLKGKLKTCSAFTLEGYHRIRHRNSSTLRFEQRRYGLAALVTLEAATLRVFWAKDFLLSDLPITFYENQLPINTISHYRYDTRQGGLEAFIPLPKKATLSFQLTTARQEGDAFPYGYVYGKMTFQTGTFYKRLRSFLNVQYLHYDNKGHPELNTQGAVYTLGLSMRVGP